MTIEWFTNFVYYWPIYSWPCCQKSPTVFWSSVPRLYSHRQQIYPLQPFHWIPRIFHRTSSRRSLHLLVQHDLSSYFIFFKLFFQINICIAFKTCPLDSSITHHPDIWYIREHSFILLSCCNFASASRLQFLTQINGSLSLPQRSFKNITLKSHFASCPLRGVNPPNSEALERPYCSPD